MMGSEVSPVCLWAARRTLYSNSFQQWVFPGKGCSLLSRSSAFFVELMAMVDNPLSIPSSNVITRWRFGVKKQVHEGQTLCSLHLEHIINYLALRENILFQCGSRWCMKPPKVTVSDVLGVIWCLWLTLKLLLFIDTISRVILSCMAFMETKITRLQLL